MRTPWWGEGGTPAPVRAALAIAGPAIGTAIGLGIGERRTTAAALVYLLGVLGVAVTAGAGPGVAAAILSFMGLNFFFTPPFRTLSVGKTDDLIALVVFLVVGLVVSSLVTLGLTHRARARRIEDEARTLYAISSRLTEAADVVGVLEELAGHMATLLRLSACEIEVGTHRARAGSADSFAISFPISRGADDLGRLRLAPTGPFDESERRVASILAGQIALAYQRSELARVAHEARVATEAGRIRRALVSAVSHEFRTPLASIKAAVTALLAEPGTLSRADADELLRTALEETERLDRLVANLLDLARLRAGTLAPDRASVGVDEVVDDALASLRGKLGDHRLAVGVRADVPPLDVDRVQVAQVLRNVLENAAKFAPNGTEIKVTAVPWRDSVEVRVSDRGPGIETADREAVFEEFYRGSDSGRSGSGIGLALARAIVRAHGGQIWVEGTPGGGATVVIRLPGARTVTV